MFERIGNVSVQVGSERACLLRVQPCETGSVWFAPITFFWVTAGSSRLRTELESCGGVGA